MFRGTTPSITFTLPFDTSELKKCVATFAQNNVVIFEHTMSEMTFDGTHISLKLTELETLSLNSKYDVQLQLRVQFNDGRIDASKVITTTVEEILRDGRL